MREQKGKCQGQDFECIAVHNISCIDWVRRMGYFAQVALLHSREARLGGGMSYLTVLSTLSVAIDCERLKREFQGAWRYKLAAPEMTTTSTRACLVLRIESLMKDSKSA